MLRPLLIPGTSLRISEMALGTMNWGTSVSLDAALRLFDLYRANSGNVLDTAHLYACWASTPSGENGLGASEKTLGALLKQRDSHRRHLVILSKGGHPAFLPNYPRDPAYLSPAVVRRDLAESLARLGLPMLDLYFLHRDDRRVPVGELVDLLNELVTEGFIRYFGASNWSGARIAQANAYAAAKGVMGFVASQPEFSLAVPSTGTKTGGAEPALDTDTRFLTSADFDWHLQTRFPAFCYSPTARGYFATAGTKAGGGAAADFDHPESRTRLARAQELAAQHRATPNQIALAWLRSQKFPALPILGPSTVDHLKDALDAADVRLTPDETRWLSS